MQGLEIREISPEVNVILDPEGSPIPTKVVLLIAVITF